MDLAELSLTWDDHHNALIRVFEELLQSNTLVDCTIAAEGQYLKAHKVVLSACSPYFQMLFSQENEKNPIVVLKDMKFQELKAVIEFVYRGQVKVLDCELEQFLQAAESLQIRGLANHEKKMSPEHNANIDLPLKERSPTPPIPRKRRRAGISPPREEDTVISPRDVIHNDANASVDIGISSDPMDVHGIGSVGAGVHAPTLAVPTTPAVVSTSTSAAPSLPGSNRVQTRVNQQSYPPPTEVLADVETVIKLEPEPEPDPEPEPMPDVFVVETKNEEYRDDMKLLERSDGNVEALVADVSGHQSLTQFPVSSPDFHGTEDSFLTSQIGEQGGGQGEEEEVTEDERHAPGNPTQIFIMQSGGEGDTEPHRDQSSASSSQSAHLALPFADHRSECGDPLGLGTSEATINDAMPLFFPIDLEENKGNIKIPWTFPQHAVVQTSKQGRNRQLFKCTFCKFTSNLSVKFRFHMWSHLGIKPFICGDCNYATVTRKKLNEHMRIHTGEKPYSCPHCDYRGRFSAALSSHIKNHHGKTMRK